METKTKTKKRNVISRNHYEYQVVMSEKFINELGSIEVSEVLCQFGTTIGTVSSSIEFKLGDKINISTYSFEYMTEGEDKFKDMEEDKEKLDKKYNLIDGALPCNVVDIYFDLSFQNNDYYDENGGAITPFINSFPNASWVIVIEPI